MAFMRPEYSDGNFVRVENSRGESLFVPEGYEDLDDDEEITERYVGKWFYHLSASGYMDQTEWTGPFNSENEAREDCRETFDVDPDTGDELEDETLGDTGASD